MSAVVSASFLTDRTCGLLAPASRMLAVDPSRGEQQGIVSSAPERAPTTASQPNARVAPASASTPSVSVAPPLQPRTGWRSRKLPRPALQPHLVPQRQLTRSATPRSTERGDLALSSPGDGCAEHTAARQFERSPADRRDRGPPQTPPSSLSHRVSVVRRTCGRTPD